MKVKEAFATFNEWDHWWHQNCVDPAGDMYRNGQYDELPFVCWDYNVEMPETLPSSRAGRRAKAA